MARQRERPARCDETDYYPIEEKATLSKGTVHEDLRFLHQSHLPSNIVMRCPSLFYSKRAHFCARVRIQTNLI